MSLVTPFLMRPLVPPIVPGHLKYVHRNRGSFPASPFREEETVSSTISPAVTTSRSEDRGRSAEIRYGVIFSVVLAAGAAFRFWSLGSRPGWQYDEGVYLNVASNLLQHGTINEHITYGASWSPDLYQPPYYFLLLSRWFFLTGPGIYHARILGVLFSLGTLILLWRLLTRLHRPQAALFAMLPIVFDGWLMYVQRVSYMENLLLMLVTAGMLLYQRALEKPEWWRFIAAGIVLGFAVAVKYTGVSALAAILLCWLILHRSHGGHLLILSSALTTLAGCTLLEASWFDVAGQDWWVQDTLVQVRRVLGIQSSGGTLTSPTVGLHLLLAQYDVFIASFAVAAITFLMMLRRLWTCYRARNWQPVADNALLWSWMVSGVAIFGVSSLKYTQYFALILVPIYAWFWTEAWHWRWNWRFLRILVTVAILAGMGSFYERIASRYDNVFADVQAYAATSIPSNAVVVADEAIGDLIQQPYCQEQYAEPCANVATYLITWNTYLQSTWNLGDAAYRQIVVGAVPIRSWTGFNGTATVWRLRN